MKQQHPMFITTSDMKKVFEGARSGSWCMMWYRNMRSAYGMEEPQKIPSLRQFCEYFGLLEEDVKQKLGWTKQDL